MDGCTACWEDEATPRVRWADVYGAVHDRALAHGRCGLWDAAWSQCRSVISGSREALSFKFSRIGKKTLSSFCGFRASRN